MSDSIKAMIFSLGGTSAPVIHSLNESKPQYICFFVSGETKGSIKEVLSKISFRPCHHEWIVTPNPELLSQCYDVVAREFPRLLEKWDIGPQEVCVDYTGGTKTMSAALVLATVDHSCCYSYVGGSERSKGGVGVVLDGKEKRWFLDNPWDSIALKEKKEVVLLFNKARYASASQILDRCVEKVSRDRRPYFKALHELVAGYDLWDRFKHQEAKNRLYRGRDVIHAFAQGTGKKDDLLLAEHVDSNIRFLENLISGHRPSMYFCYDLLANARRRADLEQKFDDATARLYRTIELLAQVELKDIYGIETSDVTSDLIPKGLRDEYLLRYREERDGKIKIPLFASFRLLKELGDQLGERFFQLYDAQIRPVLNLRNSSILAHGLVSIEEKTFRNLWDALLRLFEVEQEQIPMFPELKA